MRWSPPCCPASSTRSGWPPRRSGWIEGAADALSSFVKLGAGWYSDRIGHRKGIVAFGYFLSGTGLALFALAVSWPLVLAGRMVAWFGKGIRGPLRDALLAESVRCRRRAARSSACTARGIRWAPCWGRSSACGCSACCPRPTPDAPFRAIFVLSLVPG